MSGPLYHTLIKGPALPTHQSAAAEALRKIKTHVKKCDIPFVLQKRESAPGFLYAQSFSHEKLVEWVKRIESIDPKNYKCELPPAPAPVSEDKAAMAPGQRYIEVKNTTKFGEELAKRGLIDWHFKHEGFHKTT